MARNTMHLWRFPWGKIDFTNFQKSDSYVWVLRANMAFCDAFEISADTFPLHIFTWKEMTFSYFRYGRWIMLIFKFSENFAIFTFHFTSLKCAFLTFATLSEASLWAISDGRADYSFSSAHEFRIPLRVGYADPPRLHQYFHLWRRI
jgi:hypothetical protein